MIVGERGNRRYNRTYRRRYRRRRLSRAVYMRRLAICASTIVILAVLVCAGLLICNLFQTDQDVQTVGMNQSSVSDPLNDGNPMVESDSEALIPSEPESIQEDDGITVVLDAGHGGKDGGSFQGDIVEKDITLAVVLLMKEMLEKEDISVVLTRKEDEFLSLKDRTIEANKANGDLFVSIHCNYFEDDDAVHGLECYYYMDSQIGQYYAESFIETLKGYDGIRVRSAKPNDYFVLTYTNMPGVLVEMGFLSNPEECRKLASQSYQKTMAEGLVQSILDSIEAYEQVDQGMEESKEEKTQKGKTTLKGKTT